MGGISCPFLFGAFMLEKLFPGDRVMCIPVPSDGGRILIPYGTCGIVINGEEEHYGITLFGKPIKKVCCVVRFENHLCPFHESGNWLRVRPGLMKITPDETMREEEREVMELDALPPLVTIEQVKQMFERKDNV